MGSHAADHEGVRRLLHQKRLHARYELHERSNSVDERAHLCFGPDFQAVWCRRREYARTTVSQNQRLCGDTSCVCDNFEQGVETVVL